MTEEMAISINNFLLKPWEMSIIFVKKSGKMICTGINVLKLKSLKFGDLINQVKINGLSNPNINFKFFLINSDFLDIKIIGKTNKIGPYLTKIVSNRFKK